MTFHIDPLLLDNCRDNAFEFGRGLMHVTTMYPMFCNSASGPGLGLPGRMSAGFLSEKPHNQASGRRAASENSDVNPAEIRRGSPIFVPEALLHNKGYAYVT